VADRRKLPQSKYTAERDIPGAFEGETVTRRRFMTLTAHYVPRVITEVTGIGDVGKTTVYMRAHNDDLDGPIPAGIPGGGQFIAISTRCMHLGCPVRWVQAAERFICPCHGGVYDLTGKRSGGPPVRPLDRFYTRVSGGQVEIGPRYSSYRDPGQDLDGIGQYLYPGRFSTPKLSN
jgi:Rieske Fe-S protein